MSTLACHLFVPGLSFSGDEAASHFGTPSIELPTQLRRITARGERNELPTIDPSSALLHLYGVRSDEAKGAAPLMAEGDGISVDEALWLCADPVHLRVEQDRLVLLDAEFLSPEIGESLALIETLNTHFADDGMRFVAMSAHRWYMQLTSNLMIATSPLNTVLGRDIHKFLPRGNDAMLWRRRLNELQMLLHAHPVNAAREQRGALPINSVWWWGEGHPASAQQCFSALAGDDALLRGLAKSTRTPIVPTPVSAAAWLESQPVEGEHLVSLEALRRPWAYRLENEWHTALGALELNWFAPLVGALRAGRISELKISALTTEHYEICRFTKKMLWRFWRR